MSGGVKKRTRELFVTLLALFVGLILIFPIIYCILGAFKTHAEFMTPKLLPESFANLSNFRNALRQAPLLRYMLNSCIVSVLGTVVRLALSVSAAFALTHYDFRGKNLCFFLLLGTMMIPGDTLIVTNYITVSRLGLLNSYLGMTIVSFVSASQLFLLRQQFLSLPGDLYRAAQLDGCGDLRYILQFLLPVCRPVITTLFVQSFISLWNAYLWPLIVTAGAPDMRTVMVGITKLNSFEDTNYELVLAGVTISLIPSFVLFVIMRRNMRRGGTDGAQSG